MMQEQLERVEIALDRLVPSAATEPVTIHEAIRYSLFAGGKRIRPFLAIAAAHAVHSNPQGIEDAASALEMIHTYSLIHDDLPDMDNDDFRRGRPTCHKVYGNAIAILAGDALCTLAFQVLGSLQHADDKTRARLVVELAMASGTVGGMIGGQVHDIEGEGKEPDAVLLDQIHRAKTGALLRASVRIGAIFAGATHEQLESLSSYGEHIGLAFQIVDDVLDVESSTEVLGKTAGKDAEQKKITFPAVYGLERSRQMAEAELHAAHDSLKSFDHRADELRRIADKIVHRNT